jgi:hypothetical protein
VVAKRRKATLSIEDRGPHGGYAFLALNHERVHGCIKSSYYSARIPCPGNLREMDEDEDSEQCP